MPTAVDELDIILDEFVNNYGINGMKMKDDKYSSDDITLRFKTINEFMNYEYADDIKMFNIYSNNSYCIDSINSLLKISLLMTVGIIDNEKSFILDLCLHQTSPRFKIIYLELNKNFQLSKKDEESFMKLYTKHRKLCGLSHTKSARGYAKAAMSQDS